MKKLKSSEQTYTPESAPEQAQQTALTTNDKMRKKGKKSAAAKPSEKSDQSDTTGNTILFSMTGDLETPAHIVEVPELEIDVNNTEAVKQYLKDHILGKNIYIKHDGRPVVFYSPV